MTQGSASVSDQADETHAVGRVIANFAGQHMRAATTFRDHVQAIERANLRSPLGPFFEELRSYGSGCIMSAAASLEALINEFFIATGGPLRSKIADFEVDFWGGDGIERKPILEKYQFALEMLGQVRLNEQVSPYRDAWALIELRNALVHYKPTWDPDRRRKVNMIEVLRGKYELSPFVDDNADFVTERSMSGSCMSWAVATCISFLREFHDRARIDDQKMAVFWQFDD